MVAFITIANLRGLRESGNIFAIPTYLFVASAILMIGLGAYRSSSRVKAGRIRHWPTAVGDLTTIAIVLWCCAPSLPARWP